MDIIYLAGGCFWGMEKLFSSIYGVTNTEVGYANGKTINPTYQEVCKGDTGFRETIKVTYDSSIVSLETILDVYFYIIDPTVHNNQGNDYGPQYQTGIYYVSDEEKKIVDKVVSNVKKGYKVFATEVLPLVNFYKAEEYHQKYLDKNPSGYCHISPQKIKEAINKFNLRPNYVNPDEIEIKNKLSELQYDVTRNKATEAPFTSEYYDSNEKGIYVDVITGEPLFSSSDKYLSSCGWPSFDKGILGDKMFKANTDYNVGYARTEIESSAGNHLGHRFEGDYESPNGTRYCINGASIKFIPFEKMDELGYSKYKKYVK